jgi:hypothetical protein
MNFDEAAASSAIGGSSSGEELNAKKGMAGSCYSVLLDQHRTETHEQR